MKKLILFLFAVIVFLPSITTAGDKEDQKKITDLIDNICKRKDIDKIKIGIKSGAKYYYQDQEKGLLAIVEERDKERALGTGSYEDVIGLEVVVKDEMAFATFKTKYTAKEKVITEEKSSYWSYSSTTKEEIKEVTYDRYNTVILEKKKDEWKIIVWHASEECKKSSKK